MWAIATFPRPSDGCKLVRSSIHRGVDTQLRFKYFGTKELRCPVFTPELAVPQAVHQKICPVLNIECYLDRSKHFKHSDRVWCARLSARSKAIPAAVGPETLSRWMRDVMSRAGVPEHFTGGSVRMAGASRAIDLG